MCRGTTAEDGDRKKRERKQVKEREKREEIKKKKREENILISDHTTCHITLPLQEKDTKQLT